jgi:hypothetical protein
MRSLGGYGDASPSGSPRSVRCSRSDATSTAGRAPRWRKNWRIMELTEVIKEKVRDEGFDAYMEGAARMMTVVALMRSIGSIDAEEAEDMLERVSALVMRGAKEQGRSHGVHARADGTSRAIGRGRRWAARGARRAAILERLTASSVLCRIHPSDGQM